MSIRTLATLAAAAFLGLLAVFLVRNYLLSAREVSVQTGNAGPVVPVVVAAQAVERGAVLQPDMLKVVGFPQGAAPVGAFQSIGQLTGANNRQRLALRSMVINEPILPANVSGPGDKLNLSTLIAPGMRAVSLRSSDVIGVGGFVLPGDRVDVLLTRTTGSGQQTDTITQVLAENVRVLGVDQSDNDEANVPVVAKAVTLEVTPEQAEKISLGESAGTVALALRHVADDTPVSHQTMTTADLGGAARHSRAVSGNSGGVRVIRGVDSSRFSFAVGHSLERAAAPAAAGVASP